MLAVRIDSVKNPPWGMAGGMAGGVGRVVVNPGTNHERLLQPLSDGNMLKRGDVLRIETGGGGGYGHPFDRPPESVLDDVLGGFVTAARRRLYGVAIDDDAMVDPSAPRKLRAKRRRVKAFHRHEYVDSPGLTRRSPSPSISAAPSPTSPCTTPRAAGSGAPRRRACRAIPSQAFLTGIRLALEEAGRAAPVAQAACCTARPSPPT